MLTTYIVYILFNSKRGKIYIGMTSDLTKRLLRHNSLLPNKKTSYTYRNNGKWNVVYTENHSTRNEALKREKWFKSGIGREFIKLNLDIWIESSSMVDPPPAGS